MVGVAVELFHAGGRRTTLNGCHAHWSYVFRMCQQKCTILHLLGLKPQRKFWSSFPILRATMDSNIILPLSRFFFCCVFAYSINMPLAKDLLNPTVEEEKRKCKLKRLVQSPNSYFMDVKCPGCYKITTVFSHAQTVVLCVGCSTVLCQPTGGKARLTEGCSFRRKQH